MDTYEDLKALGINLKKDFENKTRTLGYITQLSSFLEKYLENPELCFREAKAKAYFFEEFCLDFIQSLSKLTHFTAIEVNQY